MKPWRACAAELKDPDSGIPRVPDRWLSRPSLWAPAGEIDLLPEKSRATISRSCARRIWRATISSSPSSARSTRNFSERSASLTTPFGGLPGADLALVPPARFSGPGDTKNRHRHRRAADDDLFRRPGLIAPPIPDFMAGVVVNHILGAACSRAACSARCAKARPAYSVYSQMQNNEAAALGRAPPRRRTTAPRESLAVIEEQISRSQRQRADGRRPKSAQVPIGSYALRSTPRPRSPAICCICSSERQRRPISTSATG